MLFAPVKLWFIYLTLTGVSATVGGDVLLIAGHNLNWPVSGVKPVDGETPENTKK